MPVRILLRQSGVRALAVAMAVAGCGGGEPAGGPVDGASGDDGSPVDAEVQPPATGVYLLYERFDAMTTGAAPDGEWAVDATSGGVVVREIPFAADKSASIEKPAGAGSASLGRTFAAQSGRVVFEAKVRARETAGFKAIPYIYDASGAAVASVSFQDGNIEAHVGDARVVVQPFAAGLWYRVRVVVDTDRGTFDLYVDGVRKLRDQALRAAATSVAALRYYVDGDGAGELLVDNVKIYVEATFIGAPPAPVFDPRAFGATGDGTTDDRAALQAAIDAAAGTDGSVVLEDGTFRSGSLSLHAHMTLFIRPSATLLGSASAADYPEQSPATGNTQLGNCRRALLYANDVDHLHIDGGGSLDGQGDGFGGPEATRPMLIWAVLSDHVAIQNLYLKKGAMWSLVTMESDDVVIDNVNVQSDNITHDGIDVVDGTNVVVSECAVRSGDDAMCIKTGVRRGIDTVTIRDSLFAGSGTSGGSNGIKLGTGTYGAVTNLTIEDTYVKDVQYAAMAVESRQGSDIDGVTFRRVELANAGSAFFVYLAQQATTHPIGDVPKLGSMTHVAFTDIAGWTGSWPNSPHQAALITGHDYDGTIYPITNLAFTNVALTFTGGRGTVPGAPPEATPNQYPESNMFGDLPAAAYYLRHVDGVTFTGCRTTLAAPDARPELVTDDVASLVGTP